MIKTRWIAFIAFIFMVSLAFGQAPYFRHLTSKDGLPNSTVYSMVQDSLGYMWLGTENGLCRYDGVNFVLYKTPSETSISADALNYDGGSRIYFKNFSNQFFYIESDSIHEIPILPRYGQLHDIALVSPDEILVNLDSIYLYLPKEDRWEGLLADGKDPTIIDQKNRKIYIQREKAIIASYDLNSKEEDRLTQIQQIVYFLKAHNDKLFAIGPSKSFSLEYGQVKWESVFTRLNKYVTGRPINSYTDRDGRYWIASTNGAVCFTDENTPYLRGLTYLQDNFISDFTQDVEGNYWFTTIGNGVFVMYQDDALVYDKNNSTLYYDQVKRLQVIENDELLVATNGKKAYHLSAEGDVISTYDTPMGDIECILYDYENEHIYLESLLYHKGKPSSYSKVFGGYTPKNITIYDDDYLIFASGDGAYLVRKSDSKKSGWPSGYEPSPQNGFEPNDLYPNALALRKVRSRDVYFDSLHQTIWIAFIDGLYSVKNGKMKELTFKDNKSITALDITAGADNSFYIGTVNSGVLQIKEGQIESQLTVADGLLSNYIRVIKSDKDHLYLGTEKGLQQYNLSTGESRVFNEQDGLPTNDITDIGITSNTIWISTLSGLVSLPKPFNGYNTTPPKVYLGTIAVNGSAIDRSNSEFAHFESDLTFSFTGIAHRSEGNFQFKYRLKGLSDQWTMTDGSTREARFFSLPPGAYQFQLEALNEDGLVSRNQESYAFTIARPFWQEWWFVLVVLVLTMGLISGIFLMRIRRIKRENRLEKAMQNASLHALKLQMNPHFLFNSLTAIQDYILKEKPEQASHYVGTFSTLMREILENSRREYITIQTEVEMLNKYLQLQQVRFDHPIDYEIEIADAITADYEGIPPMFAQPFIENSIEHGLFKRLENKIKISFLKQHEKLITVQIEDNGIGIKDTKGQKNHHSLASTIVKERLALLSNIAQCELTLSMENITDHSGIITGFIV